MSLSCELARYRFTLAFEQPFTLPLYSGSMLRGAFGHALRHISCVTRQKTCDNCPLLNGCHYPRVFEPKLLGSTPDQPQPAPPYILEPPAGPRDLSSGEEWSFDIVLYGSSLPLLSMIILAMTQAAARGFGSQHIPAKVLSVAVEQSDGWQVICSSDDPIIKPHNTRIDIPTPANTENLTLELITPTRLLRQGHPVGPEKLSGRDFYSALLRRGSQIAEAIGLIPPSPMHLSEFPLLAKNLRWLEWSRYSSRQKQSMQLGGLIGTFALEQWPEELWTWLWLGQWCHIGKNASFGLGKYRLLQQ